MTGSGVIVQAMQWIDHIDMILRRNGLDPGEMERRAWYLEAEGEGDGSARSAEASGYAGAVGAAQAAGL